MQRGVSAATNVVGWSVPLTDVVAVVQRGEQAQYLLRSEFTTNICIY